ncbi:unnamed protein product [Gordionus sp. m RMFG-2023]
MVIIYWKKHVNQSAIVSKRVNQIFRDESTISLHPNRWKTIRNKNKEAIVFHLPDTPPAKSPIIEPTPGLPEGNNSATKFSNASAFLHRFARGKRHRRHMDKNAKFTVVDESLKLDQPNDILVNTDSLSTRVNEIFRDESTIPSNPNRWRTIRNKNKEEIVFHLPDTPLAKSPIMEPTPGLPEGNNPISKLSNASASTQTYTRWKKPRGQMDKNFKFIVQDEGLNMGSLKDITDTTDSLLKRTDKTFTCTANSASIPTTLIRPMIQNGDEDPVLKEKIVLDILGESFEKSNGGTSPSLKPGPSSFKQRISSPKFRFAYL